MFSAIAQITGKSASYTTVDSKPFTTAFNAGKLITFGSFSNPVDAGVVGGDQAKAAARQSEVLIASMDDHNTFGAVFHELQFGAAVAQQLLTESMILSTFGALLGVGIAWATVEATGDLAAISRPPAASPPRFLAVSIGWAIGWIMSWPNCLALGPRF
jgi:hypothetical protein